ncbi:MAG: hypothetical protein BGO78_05565 [Chloroflexi bacterium 44-23]|nr:MAG: hypothetical protein BGO78_05565 [Chloroflexi bacterium 44-23]
MRLSRPILGSLSAILILLAIFTFNVQASGIDMRYLLAETPFSIFLPMVRSGASSSPPPPSPSPTSPVPTVTILPPGGGMIINHNSIGLYDRIPSSYLRAAEAIKFTFMDRSVGANIDEGIGCLAAVSWEASNSACRRGYVDASLTNWVTYPNGNLPIPTVITFPGGNNRSNIHFVYHEGTWEEDLSYFIQSYPNYANQDIFSYQHNYLHVAAGSTIDDVYFDPNYRGTNIYDLEALEDRYPNKTFVYWTASLARTIGSADAQSFNDQMRSWAAQNGKILIDIAAIESHAPNGTACRNSQGYEIICKDYTTEANGGHLGSVSGGKIRIAKAIWVTLAQIAGWQP